MLFKRESDEVLKEEELIKEQLLSKGELSLMIKDYNDIFSSFDPRPYSERALSDDFLLEAKRATRDKHGVYELRFLISKTQRNFEHEFLIKKRLREHFKKHYRIIVNDLKETERRGAIMAIVGVLFIFAAAYLDSLEISGLFWSFLRILLEPAGWFTAWTGLDQLYYTLNEKKPDNEFYRKMSEANIHFSSY